MKNAGLLSICTTNYYCAHALERHLESVFRALQGVKFEYIVVDNRSGDRSLEILEAWASRHPDMRVMSRRCTMGEGRQIAFRNSSGSHILIVDTDVAYSPRLREFVDAYFGKSPTLSVQALFAAIFPRDHWLRIGGRRSLNTNEDVDMWVRLAALGLMRWYPVAVGENLKDPDAVGSYDHLSKRYPRRIQFVRLLRREWDLLKTRNLAAVDIQKLIDDNLVDLGLEVPIGPWPQARVRLTRLRHAAEFARQLKLTLRSSQSSGRYR